MRRTGTGMVVALLGFALVACGDGATTARDPDAQAPAGASSTTPGEGPEGSCPERLPQPAPEETTADAPATAIPALTAPDRAWRCRYVAGGDGFDGGAGLVWALVGRSQPVDAGALPALVAGLDRLAPADPQRYCSQELGARWLLVLDADAGLTGVVIDDFGCHDVRLTDDPATVPPGTSTGPGVVPGVLDAPGALVDAVTSGGRVRPASPTRTAPPG